jgi:hypothetical protein
MLGRWHEIDGTGFAIREPNDPKVMFSGIGLQWVGEMQVMNFLGTKQDGRPK